MIGIMDTTDTSLLFTLFRNPRPKVVDSLVLNESQSYAFYDLTKIEDNGYIEIINQFPEGKRINYFFSTENNYGLFDFYQGFFNACLTS